MILAAPSIYRRYHVYYQYTYGLMATYLFNIIPIIPVFVTVHVFNIVLLSIIVGKW